MTKECKKMIKILKKRGFEMVSENKHIKMRNAKNKTIILSRNVADAAMLLKKAQYAA